jgi:hypothetical protein
VVVEVAPAVVATVEAALEEWEVAATETMEEMEAAATEAAAVATAEAVVVGAAVEEAAAEAVEVLLFFYRFENFSDLHFLKAWATTSEVDSPAAWATTWATTRLAETTSTISKASGSVLYI